MRVLVVEDESRMAGLIRQGLEEEAYAVDVVGDGASALAQVHAAEYDIVLLDIMLPGVDGVEVCRRLRRQRYVMPILMLTARDTTTDKVRGLDSGADDYLAKPFAIEELTARMRALVRREGPSKTTELRVGDLVLDTATKRARRDDRVIDLTAKEYGLLETLMLHPGQVLSRDQITGHVWNRYSETESKVIEVHIHSLRKKIDEGHTERLIQTVRGLGYRIGARTGFG
ncbi:MAG: response regulator transcription factor [Thermoleophilia bacterium]